MREVILRNAALLLGAVGNLLADTITVFDVAGASQTVPAGINASGAVTGYYVGPDTQTHGFLRSSAGVIVTFDVAGAFSTIPAGINNAGTITGVCLTSASPNPLFHGFSRDNAGVITMFDVPGATGTTSSAINSFGDITGTYSDQAGVRKGFIRSSSGAFTTFTILGSHGLKTVTSINDNGSVTGAYTIGSAGERGFARDPNGILTTFDGVLTANVVRGTNINSAGTIAGEAFQTYGTYDAPSNWRALIRTSNGNITTFKLQTGVWGYWFGYTQPVSINASGQIAGSWFEGTFNSRVHGFLREANGGTSTFDAPGAASTQPSGMNDSGIITGTYATSAPNTQHGFVRTP